MKLKCLQCGHEYEGSISLDSLGWHSSCPVCEGSFDVDVPKGRVVMAFTNPFYDAEYPYATFTDDFNGEGITAYYAFPSVQSFIRKWKKVAQNPDGMWYWVLDNGRCICSGACDPDDIFNFHDYWKCLDNPKSYVNDKMLKQAATKVQSNGGKHEIQVSAQLHLHFTSRNLFLKKVTRHTIQRKRVRNWKRLTARVINMALAEQDWEKVTVKKKAA